jgi:hypothetical protein
MQTSDSSRTAAGSLQTVLSFAMVYAAACLVGTQVDAYAAGRRPAEKKVPQKNVDKSPPALGDQIHLQQLPSFEDDVLGRKAWANKRRSPVPEEPKHLHAPHLPYHEHCSLATGELRCGNQFDSYKLGINPNRVQQRWVIVPD